MFLNPGDGDFSNVVPLTFPDTGNVDNVQAGLINHDYLDLLITHNDGTPPVVFSPDTDKPTIPETFDHALTEPLGDLPSNDAVVQDNDGDSTTPPPIIIGTDNAVVYPEGPPGAGQQSQGNTPINSVDTGPTDGSGNIPVVLGTDKAHRSP